MQFGRPFPARRQRVGANDHGRTNDEDLLSGADLEAEGIPDRPLAGRLVQPDGGVVDVDETPEELGEAVPDAAGSSAEEAAMRVVTDPEGLGPGGDGYLDDDED